MRAAFDLVLFIVTTYDYFFGKRPVKHVQKKRNIKFHSVQHQDNENLFVFDSDESDEENNFYQRLDDQQIETPTTYTQSIQNGFNRFVNGTKELMDMYAKRRQHINRETIKQSETLTDIHDFIVEKIGNQQDRINTLMVSRKAHSLIQNYKVEFASL